MLSQGSTDPKKVPFRVVYSTGWDDDYPVKNLEVHSPFIKGWRSTRYCVFPQEIVVKIDPPCRFRKLQLLSHQYLIASTVELYVGHNTSEGHTSLRHAEFTRLGYVSLSSNESTRYKTMELKSVNVDCIGELVKLVLNRNHINQFNTYNQIGLVALNIIGEPIPTTDKPLRGPRGMLDLMQRSTSNEKLASLLHYYLPDLNLSDIGSSNPVLRGTIRPPRVSPVDDLSFAVAQDPQTADIVRKLERRKAAAIDEENYQEAKRLKMVVKELCKAGEVLCRHEVEKKDAIAREDYDTAKAKKEKIDNARKMIYNELNIHGLLSGGKRPAFSKQSPQHHALSHVRRSEGSARERISKAHQRLLSLEEVSRSTMLPPITRDSKSPPPLPGGSSMGRSTERLPADERPLPALAKRSGDLEAHPREDFPEEGLETEREGVDGGGGAEDIQTEPLTEKQINEVSQAVETFGMELCEQLYAKQFSFRERGLTAIQQVLASQPNNLNRRDTASLLKATCQVLVKGFKDKVFSTFTRTQELLQYTLGTFAQSRGLTHQDFAVIVEKVAPTLLVRTGDLSPRIHEVSQDILTDLIRHDKIKEQTLFGPMLVEPFKAKNPSWRLIRSRIILLERLKEDPGFTQASGLTVKKVMKFIVDFLDHSSGEVRDTVIKLILGLYQMNGPDVRSLMPVPDTTASRKKKLWKTVFEGFDKIDGVPTPAEREALSKAAETAKNEEILKLQRQVEIMRGALSSTAEAASTKADGSPGHSVKPAPGSSHQKAAPSGSGHQRAVGAAPGHGTEENDTIDKMCVFCGKHQESLQSEAAMEQHYLEECPMLHSCPQCHQVIEIPGLTKHWLTECESKALFRQCPLCKDAILKKQFDSHVEAGNCLVGPQDDKGAGSNRCPLCHQNIPAGEEGWRTHLMGPVGHPATCPNQKKRPADQEELALPELGDQEGLSLPDQELSLPEPGDQEELALPDTQNQEELALPETGDQEELALPDTRDQEELALPETGDQEELALPPDAEPPET